MELSDTPRVRDLLYLHLCDMGRVPKAASLRTGKDIPGVCEVYTSLLKAGLPLGLQVFLRARPGLKKSPVDKATRLLRAIASHPQDCCYWRQRERCLM